MTGQILVTGSSGLVCSRFVELFPRPELLLTPDEVEFNLLQPETLKSYLANHQPEVVINFAAFTDVSAAENQRNDKTGLCWRLNVDSVKHLVSALPPSTRFIQISTDMVFSGSVADPGPYSEDHSPEQDSAKVPWYGYTKSQGELAAGAGSTIVRFNNPVRAKFSGKLDYFRKPLSLYDQGKLYPMFSDQHITLSFIDEIAEALEKIVALKQSGVFHVSSPDTTTPFDIISYLLEKSRGVTGAVQSSSLLSLNNPVRYPQFGGLKSEMTSRKLGLKFKTTTAIVDELISQGISL